MEINLPSAGEPLPAGHVRVRGADGTVQFAGRLLANSSNDGNLKPYKDKWTELELYRKTDSEQYVLHIIARSVLYHKKGGCDKGVPMKLSDLAARYLDVNCAEPIPEPCPVCAPLDIESRWVTDEVVVTAEVDWHTVYVCDTASDVLENLRRTKGKGAGQFGVPALMLLDRARVVDDDIAAELNQVRAI